MITENYYGCSDETLQALGTRALLQLLRQVRVGFVCMCGDSSCRDGPGFDAALEEKRAELFTRVKAVLATREHVPDAKEAKAIRQSKHQRKEKKQMRY